MAIVERETVLDVLDKFAKKRHHLKVINFHHSPEEIVLIDENFVFVIILPEDLPVPWQTLQLLSSILGIPINLFQNPEWIDI